MCTKYYKQKYLKVWSTNVKRSLKTEQNISSYNCYPLAGILPEVVEKALIQKRAAAQLQQQQNL